MKPNRLMNVKIPESQWIPVFITSTPIHYPKLAQFPRQQQLQTHHQQR